MIDGQEHLDPPAAGARPLVTGARAFALARHSFGDPRGTHPTEVALTSYTDTGQGTMLPGGGIRPFNVHRLVWAVIDRGGSCIGSGGPPAISGSPAPGPTPYQHCLYITFIDARTGAVAGGIEMGRPGPPN